MNVQPVTAEFYARVRTRLRGQPPAYGTDLLPRDVGKKRFFTYAAPHGVVDPIPDQRGVIARKMARLTHEQQEIATRRALAAFARLRLQRPGRGAGRLMRQAAAEAFKMDVSELFGRNNFKATTAPRQIAMALLGPLTGYGRHHVGRLLDRDHSTVSYAMKKMAGLIDGLTCDIGGVQ